MLPAAASTVEQVYGGMFSLPYQYNLEGIWYNKEIFADNGIEEPQTWDDLVGRRRRRSPTPASSPMTEAGADGWPLTRIMGMYIFRNVGPDAMAAVRDGEAKLTDPEYVAGAQALADFAEAGYFGEGFSTRDGDTSSNMFLTGQAAMTYDGIVAAERHQRPRAQRDRRRERRLHAVPRGRRRRGLDRPVRGERGRSR